MQQQAINKLIKLHSGHIFHGSSNDCLDILNATITNLLYVHVFAIEKNDTFQIVLGEYLGMFQLDVPMTSNAFDLLVI